ncbi:class I SAM-dependent methyltransferase [Pseudomonas syringae]|uniref:class I SAM-dependent methyltransferase n=1 Tax=Pseudomonas syringae TaxID=317 RepID=UPI0002A7A835|nr:class I SAM-dependent methyltransferase [Pseudomonas syringae]ELP95483.1 type 11 methyltransferase [Pseudomonas syringae BRIP34881]ELP95504.1 type 11 methyltransferase [Pseudomonas syringae BRIP34876]
MKTNNYTALAKEAFDEAAPLHWKANKLLREKLASQDYNCLSVLHQTELKTIGVKGRDIAQFNCNNGRETISIKKMGAASAVGFDISSAFIEQANELAKSVETDCEFICTDIYEIDETFNEKFDLLIITSGALCFMPDLKEYIKVARRVLRKGGVLNIYDCHPIVDMFEMDRDRGDKPLQFARSYFDKTPISHTSGLDYVGGTTYDAKEIFYFHYTMADIINEIIHAGFQVTNLKETAEDLSQAYTKVAADPITPPLSFMVTAAKQ